MAPKIKINPKGVLKPAVKRMQKQSKIAKELGLEDPYKRRMNRFKKLQDKQN